MCMDVCNLSCSWSTRAELLIHAKTTRFFTLVETYLLKIFQILLFVGFIDIVTFITYQREYTESTRPWSIYCDDISGWGYNSTRHRVPPKPANHNSYTNKFFLYRWVIFLGECILLQIVLAKVFFSILCLMYSVFIWETFKSVFLPKLTEDIK